MNTKITENTVFNDKDSRDYWISILQKRSHYSYFQTPEWSNFLLSVIPNAKPMHRWFRFSDGSKAVLPFIATPKKWGVWKLESLPWGTYGGLISSSNLNKNHIKAATRYITSLRNPVGILNLSPLDSHNFLDNDTRGTYTAYTHILSLNEDFSEIWKNQFQSRTRTAIRKGMESGIKVSWSNHPDSVQRFHELYVRCCERWEGVEVLPDIFFERLMRAPLEGMRLWLASKDNRVLAADLMFYGKGEAQYFAGASHTRFAQWNPSKVLMAKIIQDACERGYTQMNFGASGGLSGVEQFKRHFGGMKTPYVRLRKVLWCYS